MGKIFIKNRKGQRVAVVVDETTPQKGLAFVMHGLGGCKEDPHIQMFADAFLGGGYTVIRFDTTHTYGESDGKFEDVTMTKTYEDLIDVLAWAKRQVWYEEPFVLAGHSMGGMCSALYAEKYPEQVKACAPIATTVSGDSYFNTFSEEVREQWKKMGWREWESTAYPGVMKRLPYAFVADRFQYDLLSDVERLTMPILMIVGSKDTATPPEIQRVLYEKIPGRKEFHVIEGATHAFPNLKHRAEIKEIFSKWIETF